MDKEHVYPYPANYAREHGELDLYRESNRLNRECAQAIDEAIRTRPEPNYLPQDMLPNLASRFGMERVKHVLANTIHQKEYDGRFSRENKAWANTFPRLERGRECVADAHPVFVDGFASLVRRQAVEHGREAAIRPGDMGSSVRADLEHAKQNVRPTAKGAPEKKSMDR